MAGVCIRESFLAKVSDAMTTVDRAVLAIHLHNIAQGLMPTEHELLDVLKFSSGYCLEYRDRSNKAVVLCLTLSDGVNLSVHARTSESDDLEHVVLFLKTLSGLSLDDFCNEMQDKVLPRLSKFMLTPLEESGHISLRQANFSDTQCSMSAEAHLSTTTEAGSYIEASSCA